MKYVCPICKEDFAWQALLDEHETKYHPDKAQLQAALAEIERLKAKQKWIPCSERMPTVNDADYNGEVWWIARNTAVFTRNWDVFSCHDYVTHWQPTGLKRPEPPKENE